MTRAFGVTCPGEDRSKPVRTFNSYGLDFEAEMRSAALDKASISASSKIKVGIEPIEPWPRASISACCSIALHEVETAALLALKHYGPMDRDALALHLIGIGYFPAQAFVSTQQIIYDGRARCTDNGKLYVPSTIVGMHLPLAPALPTRSPSRWSRAWSRICRVAAFLFGED